MPGLVQLSLSYQPPAPHFILRKKLEENKGLGVGPSHSGESQVKSRTDRSQPLVLCSLRHSMRMTTCSLVSDSLRPHGLCPLGSSVHGVSQARLLEWVAISSSRGSSWPRDGTGSPALADSFPDVALGRYLRNRASLMPMCSF